MTVPDFYGECEDALKAILQEMTDFFTYEWQVSNSDVVIARGGDNFAILRPGAFPILESSNTGQVVDYGWNVVMEIYVKFTNHDESWENFKKLRAALIWKLGRNPLLTAVDTTKSATNVWGVTLSSDEETQYFRYDDTGDEQVPNFIIQPMTVVIRQRVEFPF